MDYFLTIITMDKNQKAASEDSVGQEYWVSDGNGGYDRYMVNATSGTYQWKNIGDTDIDLTTYAKQADLNQLER